MKPKIMFQNCLYRDDRKRNNPGTLFIFVFLTLYFLSQLSAIYLNDVRTNIKIKKEEKNKLVNSLALLDHGAAEVEERKRRGEEEEEGNSQSGAKSWRVGEGTEEEEEAAGGGRRSVRR